MPELDKKATDDIGAVQGTAPDASSSEENAPAPVVADVAGDGAAAEAPDAAEIEWAGGAIKKAPGS